MNQDFLLSNETARTLYHTYAEQMPIFDYHNHLSAQEIYEDKGFTNLTQAWLYGDHYKWRAMRTAGFPEELVTGPRGELSPGEREESDYRRFRAWAETIEGSIGNPYTTGPTWSCSGTLTSPPLFLLKLTKKSGIPATPNCPLLTFRSGTC